MKKVFRSLSNWEIDQYYQGNQYYRGCFPRDTLPKKMESGFYILNMDGQSGEGTHWTLMIKLPSMPAIIYFDPFGVICPVEALKFMRTMKSKMYYSTLDLQDIDSSLCGYYCLYVADQMMNGRNFLDICATDFQNRTEVNDNNIRHYFRNTKF
jgi:hypothetical protein